MKKLLAGAGAVVLAALPMAGVFAEDLTVTDTIQITVADACSFKEGSSTDGLDNRDTTYAATVANGQEADFSGTHSGNHQFHVTCNDKDGWKLTVTPTDLSGWTDSNKSTTNSDSIPFVTPASYTHTGTAGQWTAEITATGQTVTQPTAGGTATIVISASNAQASEFEITSAYSAYVGTQTSAGYYEGTISYVLAAL